MLLSRLVRAQEVLPENRQALAASGLWVLAPIQSLPDLVVGTTNMPTMEIGPKRVAEILLSLEPSILYRHWPGQPDELEKFRHALGKLCKKDTPTVLTAPPAIKKRHDA